MLVQVVVYAFETMQELDLSRIRQPSFSQSNSVTIGNHDSIHIILPPSAAHATNSGTLSMLHRCVVDMSRPTSTGRPFAGLTLKNINKSLIVCGHVNGAAHLTNVSNSIVVVASRQDREGLSEESKDRFCSLAPGSGRLSRI